MDTQPTGSYPTGADAIPVRDRDRVVGETFAPTPSRYTSGIAVGENAMIVRDRVQWGPILAGIFGALAIFLLMTALGIGIGASVLEPRNTGQDIGTWAAVWGAISAILAFLIGGWLAAKTAAVGGSFSGVVNGLMVGAAGLTLVIWLTASGLGNLFGTIGANVGSILNAATNTVQTTNVPPGQAVSQAQNAATQAANTATTTAAQADNPQTFEAVKKGGFGTFIGFLLPLLASALGGYLGHNKREELVRGTGV